MTSGKADRLQKVADGVACTKCHVNPRFGSLARCKACLKADAEAERRARERLLPAQPAARSNRQQAAAVRAAGRKHLATAPAAPASKALTVVARSTSPIVVKTAAAEPLRELGKPYSLVQWQTLITQTLRRWRASGTVTQNRMAEQSLAAKTIAENTGYARVTYGHNALVTLRPQSNAAASLLHWALERVGVRFDLIDVHGDIADVRTVCPHCDAKVRQPCNESRSRNCVNRSRNR